MIIQDCIKPKVLSKAVKRNIHAPKFECPDFFPRGQFPDKVIERCINDN